MRRSGAALATGDPTLGDRQVTLPVAVSTDVEAVTLAPNRHLYVSPAAKNVVVNVTGVPPAMTAVGGDTEVKVGQAEPLAPTMFAEV
jgi:hypothetical protein